MLQGRNATTQSERSLARWELLKVKHDYQSNKNHGVFKIVVLC